MDRLDIFALSGCSSFDDATTRGDFTLANRPDVIQFCVPDQAVKIAGTNFITLRNAGIQRFKHIASYPTGCIRSCEYDDISVGVGRDTEPIFHKRQVSVVFPQQSREMSIVFECYDNTFFCLALAKSIWSCRA